MENKYTRESGVCKRLRETKNSKSKVVERPGEKLTGREISSFAAKSSTENEEVNRVDCLVPDNGLSHKAAILKYV